MPSVTSLDEKLSDLVGSSSLKINNNVDVKYNFSLDQNYNDLNYSEIVSVLNYNKLGLKFLIIFKRKNILGMTNILNQI